MSAHRSALIAKLHIGKKQLGLDDDTWRGLLVSLTGVTSSKDISDPDLHRVLAHLEAKGAVFTAPKRAGPRPKAVHSASARAAQLGKLEALLADQKLPWGYAHAIARRMYHIDRVDFCDGAQLTGVITALIRRAAKLAASA